MRNQIDVQSTTHIAGPAITACGRVIQRCSLCGEKLCDSKNTAMPLNKDGSDPTFPTWEVGRMVRVEPGNPMHWAMLPDTDRLPDDTCLDLVE
jgi:hypothetical protein